MAGEPAETLVGVLGMGIGVLLLYGAYRNEPVFGSKGLLIQALQTGKLQSVPKLQPTKTQGSSQSGGLKGPGGTTLQPMPM